MAMIGPIAIPGIIVANRAHEQDQAAHDANSLEFGFDLFSGTTEEARKVVLADQFAISEVDPEQVAANRTTYIGKIAQATLYSLTSEVVEQETPTIYMTNAAAIRGIAKILPHERRQRLLLADSMYMNKVVKTRDRMSRARRRLMNYQNIITPSKFNVGNTLGGNAYWAVDARHKEMQEVVLPAVTTLVEAATQESDEPVDAAGLFTDIYDKLVTQQLDLEQKVITKVLEKPIYTKASDIDW